MIEWIKLNKAYFIGGIIILCAAGYFIFKPAQDFDNFGKDDHNEAWLEEQKQMVGKDTKTEEAEEHVIVDIKGAVKHPGVYEADADERVIDMIKKAGGLDKLADEEKINFAMRVEDEMVLYIPKEGEELAQAGGSFLNEHNTDTRNSQNAGKVNLNTATEAQLQTLPGIGPSKAAAILEFRETNGPFQDINELKSVSGIGDKTFEKLQESISVK